jgi:hypothetical protein
MMLVEKDHEVVMTAKNVYPLIFRNIPTSSVEEYEIYLQNELGSISFDGSSFSGDLFLSKLDTIELSRKPLED